MVQLKIKHFDFGVPTSHRCHGIAANCYLNVTDILLVISQECHGRFVHSPFDNSVCQIITTFPAELISPIFRVVTVTAAHSTRMGVSVSGLQTRSSRLTMTRDAATLPLNLQAPFASRLPINLDSEVYFTGHAITFCLFLSGDIEARFCAGAGQFPV